MANLSLRKPFTGQVETGIQRGNFKGKPLGNTSKFEFPLQKDFSESDWDKKKFSITLKVFVPSTSSKSKRISQRQFESRIRTMIDALQSMFGGSTTQVGFGGYHYENSNIMESVGVVTASTTVADIKKWDLRLRKLLREKRKNWGQDTIGLEYNGTMYLIK